MTNKLPYSDSFESFVEDIAHILSDDSTVLETVDYDPSDSQAVAFDNITSEAKDRLKLTGFVVVEGISLDHGGDTACKEVAEKLGLNSSRAIVPSQYKGQERDGMYGQKVSNEISPLADPIHTTFDSTKPIGVHIDGTHDPMGSIPYQILVCERQASSGGANCVYNVVNAFAELVDKDPKKAALLVVTGGFGRYSPADSEVTYGPVFAWDLNRQLISRYSETYVAFREMDPELIGALAIIGTNIRNAHNKVSIRLSGGQALVTRNDRVAHDREGFPIDEIPRKFHRLLIGPKKD